MDPSRLTIAAQLLSALLTQDRSRLLSSRMEDVQNSLLLADLLITECGTASESMFDEPQSAPPSFRERLIERRARLANLSPPSTLH